MLTKKEAQNILAQLKQDGTDYIAECKEISRVVVPSRGFYEGDKRNSYFKNFKKILSNVAIQAMYILVSGLQSGLTSKSKEWVRLTNFDTKLNSKYEIQLFLKKLEDTLMLIFDKSNVYEALPLLYKESCGFGTSVCLIEDDYDDVIRLMTFTAGQYYIDVDDRGIVNIFGRQFCMNTKNLVEKFGYKNMPAKIRDEYDRCLYNNEHSINHLICPNKKYVQDIDDNNKKFLSYYWLDESDNDIDFLHVGGYDDFPMLAHRLERRTTLDAYGIGIGSNVVSMLKEQFKKIREKLKAIEKLVNPPVTATNDIKTAVNLLPGGVTKIPADKNSGIRNAYQIAIDIGHLKADIEATKQEIYAAFFADLFSLFQKPGTTATEVVTKDGEKLAILGTFVEGFENEMLVPLVNKTINKIFQAGIIPASEIPAELQGNDIKIEFLGTLAQAQKQIGLSNMISGINAIQLISRIKQSVIDNFNEDEAIRAIFSDYGIDPRILKSPEIVANIRQVQVRQQEQLLQQQNLINSAKAAKDMSQSKIDESNLLGQIRQAMQ